MSHYFKSTLFHVSVHKLSAKLLSELPAFTSAVLGSRNKVTGEKLSKNVVSETYHFDQLTHSKLQRARYSVRQTTEVIASIHLHKFQVFVKKSQNTILDHQYAYS
jgi:hypothetical protein